LIVLFEIVLSTRLLLTRLRSKNLSGIIR